VDAIYLDPVEHRYIEEIGAANFLAFKGDTLITPKSSSILRSVTRVSLLEIASGILGWPTEERKIALDELDDMSAAACCGTAAVLCWVSKITDGDRCWEFSFDDRWCQLYDELIGIQTATRDDPFNWRYRIEV
jgi:branched-chain amino acid aminotransferase